MKPQPDPATREETVVTRYIGIVDGGLTHATRDDPEQLISGFAQAACNRNLWISVDHSLRDLPVVAALGGPRFGTGEDAHVQISESPDCLKCVRILGRP